MHKDGNAGVLSACKRSNGSSSSSAPAACCAAQSDSTRGPGSQKARSTKHFFWLRLAGCSENASSARSSVKLRLSSSSTHRKESFAQVSALKTVAVPRYTLPPTAGCCQPEPTPAATTYRLRARLSTLRARRQSNISVCSLVTSLASSSSTKAGGPTSAGIVCRRAPRARWRRPQRSAGERPSPACWRHLSGCGRRG